MAVLGSSLACFARLAWNLGFERSMCPAMGMSAPGSGKLSVHLVEESTQCLCEHVSSYLPYFCTHNSMGETNSSPVQSWKSIGVNWTSELKLETPTCSAWRSSQLPSIICSQSLTTEHLQRLQSPLPRPITIVHYHRRYPPPDHHHDAIDSSSLLLPICTTTLFPFGPRPRISAAAFKLLQEVSASDTLCVALTLSDHILSTCDDTPRYSTSALLVIIFNYDTSSPHSY